MEGSPYPEARSGSGRHSFVFVASAPRLTVPPRLRHLQATVCARAGLECVVYMGEKDMERQALNVFRMRLLGAEVSPAGRGGCTRQGAGQAILCVVLSPGARLHRCLLWRPALHQEGSSRQQLQQRELFRTPDVLPSQLTLDEGCPSCCARRCAP